MSRGIIYPWNARTLVTLFAEIICEWLIWVKRISNYDFEDSLKITLGFKKLLEIRVIHFIQFYSQTTTACLYHGSQIVYYMYFVTRYFPHLTKNHYCLLSSSYVLHFFSGIAIIVDKVMEVCWLHEISLIVNCFSKTITDHRRKICFTFFIWRFFSVDSLEIFFLKKLIISSIQSLQLQSHTPSQQA